MHTLRLEDRSARALRISWLLFLGALASPAIGSGMVRFLGAPEWLSTVSAVALLVAIVSAALVASRIRCPGCDKALLMRLAPSWHRTPPTRMKGVIRCAHCHELVDVSGGAAPPSGTSLEQTG